jgi:hypothetical protein
VHSSLQFFLYCSQSGSHPISAGLPSFELETDDDMMLPENLPAGRRNQKPLSRALTRYRQLLRHRRLLGYAGAGGFFYGGIFAYIAGTPFA